MTYPLSLQLVAPALKITREKKRKDVVVKFTTNKLQIDHQPATTAQPTE